MTEAIQVYFIVVMASSGVLAVAAGLLIFFATRKLY